MSIKHPNFPDMESDHSDSGVPGLFSSELPGLPLGGCFILREQARASGSPAASPDFLHCLHLGPGEWLLLYLASLHPQGTQLLRNSQLPPSPTLSSQTEPVKTDLRWHLWPLLATAWSTVHQQALEAQMLPNPGGKKAWADTVCETHPGKVCPGTLDLMCFFWLHPNQMELKICAGPVPLLQAQAHTSSVMQTQKTSYLPGPLSASSCMETGVHVAPPHPF